MSLLNSTLYLSDFKIINNSFYNDNIDSASNCLMFLSFYNEIYNVEFINNTMNVPFMENDKYNNLITTIKINKMNVSLNTFSTVAKKNPIFNFKNVENLELTNISLIKNVNNNNLFQIYSVHSLKITMFSGIENTSNNLLNIENVFNFILNLFSCLSNNKNHTENNRQYGSCLTISAAQNVQILNTQIKNSYSLNNIPGISISNFETYGSLVFENCVFINNIVNFTTSSNILGCALSINSFSNANLTNIYYKNNYAISGGSILVFNSKKDSEVNIKNSLIEENFSAKKSLLIEFVGTDLTISQCNFISNQQFSLFSSISSYTMILVNGMARKFNVIDTNIIDNIASDGLYFLYERKNLTITFDNVKMLYNNGSLCVGFNAQFETKNREISLKNSLFSLNSVTSGGNFIYMFVYSTIVRFAFIVSNSTIINNFSGAKSFGLAVLWLYCNNFTFVLDNSSVVSNDFPSIYAQRAFISVFGVKGLNEIIFNNSIFSENKAINMFFGFFQAYGSFMNVTFQNNQINGKEPVILARLSNLEVINSSFIENTLKFSIFMILDSYYINFSKLVVMKNIIFESFMNLKSTQEIYFESSLIENNTFANTFPMIYLSTIQNLGIKNNNFTANTGYFTNIMEISGVLTANLYQNQFLRHMNNENMFIFNIFHSYFILKNLSLNINKSEITSPLMKFEDSHVEIEGIKLDFSNSSFYYDAIINLRNNLSIKNSVFSNVSQKNGFYLISAERTALIVENSFFEYLNNVFLLKQSYFNLTLSQFENIISDLSVISLEKCYKTWIISTNFQKILSKSSTFEAKNSFEPIIFEYSMFFNVSGYHGGAISIATGETIINFCKFYNNIAQRGGALFFYCLLKNEKICNFSMNSNEFIQNAALIDGGAFKFLYVEPLDKNNTYINNTALYSFDHSGYFMKLGFEIIFNGELIFSSFSINQSEFFMLQTVNSNQIIQNYQLKFYPLDSYNQKIKEKLPNNVFVEFLNETLTVNNTQEIKKLMVSNPFYCENNEDFRYIGKISAIQDENFSFTFNEINVVSCPTSLRYLKFYTDDAKINSEYPSSLYNLENSLNEYKSDTDYFIYVPLKMNPCEQGQYYNPLLMSCYECLPNYFSFENETLTCKPCLNNAVCNGGTNLEPKNNYWSDKQLPENIYSCNVLAGSCLGNFTCKTQTKGVLCGDCIDLDGDNTFYKDNSGSCKECPNIYLIILLYLIGILIVLYLLKRIIHALEDQEMPIEKKFNVKIMIKFLHFIFYMRSQYKELMFLPYEKQTYLNNLQFFYKFEYLYIPYECIYQISENKTVGNPYVDAIFLICLCHLFIYFHYFQLVKAKKTKDFIRKRLNLIAYILMPIVFSCLNSSVIFRKVNGEEILLYNPKFTLDDAKFTLIFFIVPHLLLIVAVLGAQNIYFTLKNILKIKTDSFSFFELLRIGMKNGYIYEILSLGVMIAFFILNCIEMSLDLKSQLFFFIIFYLILLEMKFCSFSKAIYRKINFVYKLIFLYQMLIFIFLSCDIFTQAIFPLFIGFIIFLVIFIGSLVAFHQNWNFMLRFRVFSLFAQKKYVQAKSRFSNSRRINNNSRRITNHEAILKIK